MAIDDLISMRQVAPPPVTEDLARLDRAPARLAILGTTRNIDRLAAFRSVEALWVGDVDQRRFEPYVDVNIRGKPGQVMVTGKGKPMLTLPKDAARLDRYVERFRALQAKFRAAAGSN